MNVFFPSGPIDASRFNAGLGLVHGACLLSVDPEAGIYCWQAIDADGRQLSSDIFGTNAPGASEASAAADIHADILRAIPA